MPANLDNIKQTVIYIPFKEEESSVKLPSPFDYRDLPNGYDLRLQVYRAAWEQCLHHVQSVIHALHAPLASAVAHEVHTAYEGVLPGLPYPELPVICVTAPSAGPAFLSHVIRQLMDEKECHITHLWPSDCSNVMSTMKSLISGFVDKQIDGQQISRWKPDASYALYDVNLLMTWYSVNEPNHTSTLVVILHDFEMLDPVIMQDVFEICSMNIPQLPLIFLLSLSSPPSPSYIHSCYPRSTLSLLRVSTFSVPSGGSVLEAILLKTYFDPSYAPPVVLGPSTLEYIASYFTRDNSCLDSLLTTLQLAHLKHFDEPVTVLSHDSLLGTTSLDLTTEILTSPNSFPFLDSLYARLHHLVPAPSEDHRLSQSISSLIEAVDQARITFHSRARNLRVGFQLFRMVQGWMKNQGYKSAESDLTVIETMEAVMRGRLGRQVKWIGSLIQKLARAKLNALLDEFVRFFINLRNHGKQHQYEDDMLAGKKIDALTRSDKGDAEAAKEVGEWFIGYLVDVMVPLDEDCVLWDVWYTGMTLFPSEVLNPNIRASIISGLMDPFAYLGCSDATSQNDEEEIYNLPDTSILFRRYLDCGKMINVWDWFESFTLVCEGQRERERERKESKSPMKRLGKRKQSRSPTKGKEREKQKDADADEEPEEETWRLEVQARFMRALHELDYIGLIKHTGRKADHVIRTLWEGES